MVYCGRARVTLAHILGRHEMANDVLAYREKVDANELDNDWGEMLVVPWNSSDDNAPEVGAHGKCIWKV